MSVSYRIFADHGVVVVRYDECMRLDESGIAMAQYMADPGYRPGQKLLVDLTDITDWERDYVGVLKLQAQKTDQLHPPGIPSIVVAIAPHDVARQAADFVSTFWDDVGGVTYLVANSPEEAMHMIGIPERASADIMRPAN